MMSFTPVRDGALRIGGQSGCAWRCCWHCRRTRAGERSAAVSIVDRAAASEVPAEAPSARTLGQRRVGSGVIIGPQLVLTDGSFLLEADGGCGDVLGPADPRRRGGL
jgi:hypothetical protein